MAVDSTIDNGDTRVLTVTGVTSSVTLQPAIGVDLIRVVNSTAGTVTVRVMPGKKLNGVKNGTVTVPASETRTFTGARGGWTMLENSASLDSDFLPRAEATATYAGKFAAAIAGALSIDRSSQAIWPSMDPAIAPTVTYTGGGGGTTIPGYVNINFYGGGPCTLEGCTSYTNNYQSSNYVGPGSVGNETTPMWCSFDTDAATFEVMYLGSSAPGYRLIVDGEAVTDAYQSATGSTGTQHRMKVVFAGGRKMRRILIDSSSMGVRGVTVGPLDTLLPSGRTKPALAFIGDSYVANAGGEMAMVACRALGFAPVINGSGGTGYNNAGASGKAGVFSGRLAAVLANNLVGLVVFGGINDGSTGLDEDCAELVAAARAITPGLPVVIVGSQAPPAAAASAPAKSALLKAGAAATRAAYVNPVTGHVYGADGSLVQAGSAWITGTGNAGSPTGVGNADLWIADGTHPTASGTPMSGYAYHGLRLAAALRSALPVAV